MSTTPFFLRDSCPQLQIWWSSELNLPILVHFSSLIPKMSVFTLAIPCSTTSNIPWFIDLTFQFPMQYCFLQHRTLLPSPVNPQLGIVFALSLIFSLFLELFLHSAPVAYWTTTYLGSSSFSVISFCLFMLFMRFSRQECWKKNQFQRRAMPRMFKLLHSFTHHQLNGHEFEQALGDGEGQGSLAFCSPWGHEESDTWLNNNTVCKECLTKGSQLGRDLESVIYVDIWLRSALKGIATAKGGRYTV